jgi:UDP-N-acetylglucosamine:LPS N-acetylglucosamine transferase
MGKKKVLSVASIGGHWIQLLRISKSLESHYDVVYCSTHARCATMVSGHEFFQIQDFSRWDAWKLPASLYTLLGVIRKVRPSAVITTGAAPGLVALFAAKLYGVKTIWIDSVANVEHLSASGRIAHKFADRVYTQWENLATDDIYYKGNIFG